MRAKQIIIPFIDKLDSLDIAAVSDLLETEVAKHAISHVNWKEKFPYHPLTAFSAAHSNNYIYVDFFTRCNYLRAVNYKNNSPVSQDSCVEFFVRPAVGLGYINFEFNASGILLAQHITDRRRRPGTDDARPLTEEEIAGIRIYHSLPDRVEPEIPEETRYEVGFFLPFELFEKIQHAPIPVSGTVWRGNVYKCGDQTSHPHWASWRPVRRVNFHEPDCFDILEFE